MLLENKNAVIHGAGGAIGGAVARTLARERILLKRLPALAEVANVAASWLPIGQRDDRDRCQPNLRLSRRRFFRFRKIGE